MIVYAVKNGVPYDVAYCLPEEELLAWDVVSAQIENGNKEFDWDSMAFIER